MSYSYYTNVYRAGSRLFVREVRDGKRRKYRTEYKPTLYVPTTKQSKLHAPDGTPVEPIQPGNMNECFMFMKQYDSVANFRVYGNTSYEYAFLNEEYPGTVTYNINDLIVCNLDIEVESKNGYSDAKDAFNEVTAITMKSSSDGIFHVFAYGEFDAAAYNEEHKDSVIEYHFCKNEADLLEQFLDLWETLEPDIVTGWNIRLYDIPYLVNRITRIMSEEAANRMSPWGTIKETTVNIYNKQEVVYDIAGVSILDYLLIYRKNVLEPRESYRLEYIAQVELGEGKVDYGEYSGLQELYEKNFKKYIEYNIHDVRLVDRIDAKRKLIELQLLVAYHAKVNYVDVLSQVRTWDTLICNQLLAQGTVVTQKTHTDKDTQFVGAYVMKPTPGLYEWVASFDVQSLYPTIMRTLNMGMESKVADKDLTPEMKTYRAYIDANLLSEDGSIEGEGKATVRPEVIVEGLTDELIEHFREHNVTVGANGVFYRRDPKSFYSSMIEELFNNRLEYKGRYKKAVKELSTCTDPVRKAELEIEKSIFDLKQGATKILLNSLYGAMGNQFFRFFDVKNAEAVTTTGQFIIQYVGRGIDLFLNKMMKTTGKRFVVYSDTDSVYVALKVVVDKHHSHGDVYQKTKFVNKICTEALQPEIARLFRVITDRYLNGVGDALLMNREVIGDKAIWTAKKRYLVNVRDKEGITKNPAELKYMGLEIVKSSTPKFCREAMKAAVRIVMEESQKALFTFVADTKVKFKSQPVENISFPRGVNGLVKYGDPTTIYSKGTPLHTKGVLVFNHLLREQGLTTKYSTVRDGEKIKFFFLREPNPVNSPVMAFLTTLPEEFGVENYIDWELQWEKTFIEPLSLILNAIGWDTEPRANLDALFCDEDAAVCVTVPMTEDEEDGEYGTDKQELDNL